MTEAQLRQLLVELGASLFARGFSVGSAGNISVKLSDGYLMTPTNSSLGRLNTETISKLDQNWKYIGGDQPSKEVFMHRAFFNARPDIGAVVHLHSTYATAVSCLDNSDEYSPITPLTPYLTMRIGKELPVVKYYRPGDPEMEQDIYENAKKASALLLANHGSVVSGKTLASAVYIAEELEESARLSIMLEGMKIKKITPKQLDELIAVFKK